MAFDGDASDLARLALRSDGKVPVQYLGLGRDLRRRVLADDETTSAATAFAPRARGSATT